VPKFGPLAAIPDALGSFLFNACGLRPPTGIAKPSAAHPCMASRITAGIFPLSPSPSNVKGPDRIDCLPLCPADPSTTLSVPEEAQRARRRNRSASVVCVIFIPRTQLMKAIDFFRNPRQLERLSVDTLMYVNFPLSRKLTLNFTKVESEYPHDAPSISWPDLPVPSNFLADFSRESSASFPPAELASEPMAVDPPLLELGCNADILAFQRSLYTSRPQGQGCRLSLAAQSPKLLARLLISLIADCHDPMQQLFKRDDFEHSFNPGTLSPESFFVSLDEMDFTV